MLWRGRSQLDWNRLADYALRVRSQALVQRLGYLADAIGQPVETSVRDRLLAGIGKNTPYLSWTLSKVEIDEPPEAIGLPVIVFKFFRLCEISGCQVA